MSGGEPTARLFLALEVPDAVRDAVRTWQTTLRALFPPARLVRPESVHLTLLFLGDTDRTLVGPLATALESRARSLRPVRLECRSGGTFPPRGRARVVWLGLDGGAALSRLHREVVDAAVEVTGAKRDDRPYHPHVTLGRCRPPWSRRDATRFRDSAAGAWAEPFTADEVVVFESRLEPTGARHQALVRVALGSGEGSGR